MGDLERLMEEAERGFRAMQFNFVVSTNERAVLRSMPTTRRIPIARMRSAPTTTRMAGKVNPADLLRSGEDLGFCMISKADGSFVNFESGTAIRLRRSP